MSALADYFEAKSRDNGEAFYSLTDDRPDWLYEAVREAHDGEFPDDWRYKMCHSIACWLDDDEPTEDNIFEFADGATDIYNADRLRWLASSLDRVDYVNDALAEGAGQDNRDGMQDKAFDLVAAIGWAQCAVIEQMARILFDAYSEHREA